MVWYTRPWTSTVSNNKNFIFSKFYFYIFFLFLFFFFLCFSFPYLLLERGTFSVEVRAPVAVQLWRWSVTLGGQRPRPPWPALHVCSPLRETSPLDRAGEQSCWQNREESCSQDLCPLPLLAKVVTGTIQAWETAAVSKSFSAYFINICTSANLCPSFINNCDQFKAVPRPVLLYLLLRRSSPQLAPSLSFAVHRVKPPFSPVLLIQLSALGP